MPSHALPHAAKSFKGSWPTPSYSYKSKLHFKEMELPLDPVALNVQNPERSSTTWPPCATISSQWLRPSPSNLCKSAHNFRKLTIPWSSTALDRQNPKKFETKKLSRASNDTGVYNLRLTRRHAPSSSYHALPRVMRLHALYAYTCPPMLWCHGWRHPSLPRFDPDGPRNLTQSKPPVKRRK